MKMEQSVPKRRHTKFKRRGITRKKAYNMTADRFPTHSSANIPTHMSPSTGLSEQVTSQGQKFDPEISQLFQQGKGQWRGLVTKRTF